MTHTGWIDRHISDMVLTKEHHLLLLKFWNSFYETVANDPKYLFEKTKGREYKDEVFDILERAKDRFPLSADELAKTQQEIENLTMRFDQESLEKTEPNLIKMLIIEEGECAKDYLLRKLPKGGIDYDELLGEFGHYTLETCLLACKNLFPRKVHWG